MTEAISLGFACGADVDGLEIVGLEGRDGIHRPYQVDLVLARFGAALSLEEAQALVGSRSVVALGEGAGDRIHGVLESIEHVEQPGAEMQLYVARMIPETALLSTGRRSTVYQDVTVPDLARQVLTGYGLTEGDDFELRASAGGTKREYIVEYQESDWDFLARWLEHEGMFVVFEHAADRSMVVIAQDNHQTPILGGGPISHRQASNLSARGATVWDVRVRDRQVPRMVSVVDYNYRRPAELVACAHHLPAPGFGHVALYGDHCKDDAEAAAIARIRAEELAADRRVLSGSTNHTGLRAGYRFDMENHFVAEYDGSYLVTETHFIAGLPVPRGDLPTEAASNGARYQATFRAIPASVPFRPPRRTPWLSIHGIVHGHVQSDGSGQIAEIDDQGRYKVRMPFDLATRPGMTASRWIRKAQPYAGAGYGMHFPLHKGTEVLIAHLDGDPDRPIIVGAVPHATTPSPVNASNATQSVVQTATGIRVEMEDSQS